MKNLFKTSFFSIKVSDSRQSMFGKGIQVADVTIRSSKELELNPILNQWHIPFRVPFWYVILKTISQLQDDFHINLEKPIHGNLTMIENKETGLYSISDLISEYNNIQENYPDLILKYYHVNTNNLNIFDSNGAYTSIGI